MKEKQPKSEMCYLKYAVEIFIKFPEEINAIPFVSSNIKEQNGKFSIMSGVSR